MPSQGTWASSWQLLESGVQRAATSLPPTTSQAPALCQEPPRNRRAQLPSSGWAQKITVGRGLARSSVLTGGGHRGGGVLPGVLWDVRSVLDRASQGGSYWTHPQGEVRRDAHLKSGHFLPVLGGEGNTKPTPCPSGREGGKGGGCGLSWTERSWGVAAGTSSGQGVRGDPGTKPHGPGETRASLGSLSLQPFPPRSQRPQGPVRCAGAQVPHLLTS